jgi:hypothetical protein
VRASDLKQLPWWRTEFKNCREPPRTSIQQIGSTSFLDRSKAEFFHLMITPIFFAVKVLILIADRRDINRRKRLRYQG